MEEIYSVVDESDAYHISVNEFKSKAKMLEHIENRDLSDIKVYEAKRLKLQKITVISAD
jgi:hypothetical protein